MLKARHVVQAGASTDHENSYEEWRLLLLSENILSEDGLIDLERLEKKHPGELDTKQVIWIEAMQKGEVIEEGDDVAVGVDPRVDQPEPENEKPVERIKEVKSKKIVEPVKIEKQEEKEVDEAEVVDDEGEEDEKDDEELAPPPPPGAAKNVKTKDSWNIGDELTIQVEADSEPEKVTVVKIAKDGIHLASSKDEDTEYLVDPEELTEMIV